MFGDSSDHQRAARPQRKAYRKLKRQRVGRLRGRRVGASARLAKHKIPLKTDPSGALLDPLWTGLTCLPNLISPTVFGIGAIPVNSDARMKDSRVFDNGQGRSETAYAAIFVEGGSMRLRSARESITAPAAPWQELKAPGIGRSRRCGGRWAVRGGGNR